MALRLQAVRGAKWTAIAAFTTALVQLVQLIVLAHFLDKEDFGLMAIAVFVIGISQIFIDMGISNSIIHKQEINNVQLSTLYWLNIIAGSGIFLILLFLIPYCAQIYREPDLISVLNWTAITFLIQPFGQQYDALLRKELRFKALAISDITSKLIGLFVAISLASLQFGVFALVYANLAVILIYTVLLIVIGRRLYKPSFLFSWHSLKDGNFFSFGAFQMGEKIVYYFNSQFDTLIIGKLLGMEVLGVYNIAKTLAFRPTQIIGPIITKVAFPVLARVQNDTAKLKEVYLKMLHLQAGVSAPIYAALIVLAKPLVLVLFGERWIDAVPILQILSVSGFLLCIGELVVSLQLARGRADMGFYWNIVMFFFFPASAWIGHYWGVYGVATALTILRVMTFTYPVWKFFVYPLCQAKASEYFRSLLNPVIWAMISGGSAFGIVLLVDYPYYAVVAGAGVLALCYLALNLWFEKELLLEIKGFLLLKRPLP